LPLLDDDEEDSPIAYPSIPVTTAHALARSVSASAACGMRRFTGKKRSRGDPAYG
jgi:hypothetical protein